jgi:hypothetical protein
MARRSKFSHKLHQPGDEPWPQSHTHLEKFIKKTQKISKKTLKLLKERPRPRFSPPEPELTIPLSGHERVIDVQGQKVQVAGLPDIPAAKAEDSSFFVEIEDAVLEDIGELLREDGEDAGD